MLMWCAYHIGWLLRLNLHGSTVHPLISKWQVLGAQQMGPTFHRKRGRCMHEYTRMNEKALDILAKIYRMEMIFMKTGTNTSYGSKRTYSHAYYE